MSARAVDGGQGREESGQILTRQPVQLGGGYGNLNFMFGVMGSLTL